MATTKCPTGYRRGCTCCIVGDEPAEDCGYHGGGPDPRRCEFCEAFCKDVCKRCGWQRVWSAAQLAEGGAT